VTALERIQELDRQRQVILQQGMDEAVARASDALRDLKELLRERQKSAVRQA
jgi:hypothetical protein